MTPSRLLSRSASTLLAAALIVLLALAVGSWAGAYRTVTVLSDSMRPLSLPGT